MAQIAIYTKSWCGYSTAAKALLDAKGAAYTDIDVTHDPDRERVMIEGSGRRTVPQVLIDGRWVGGYDDLVALDDAGELDPLLGIGPRAAA